MAQNRVKRSSAIGIAGAGRVAQAIGRALRAAGEPVVCIAGRDPERAAAAASFIGPGVTALPFEELTRRASRLVVAVSDDAITAVAASLAGTGAREGVVLHTCGSRGPGALGPLERAGFSCGMIHPLQTIANPQDGAAALRGCSFAVCGGAAAVEWAEHIAATLGGSLLRVRPESLALYHAAAVMASNYTAALLFAAQALMEAAGVEKTHALRGLAPLALTSLRNALERGPVEALTGPIERGDVRTIRAHLEALAAVPEHIRTLYRAAGLEALEIARRRGMRPGAAQAIEDALRSG